MSTLKEIRQEIAKLEKQALEIEQQERKEAINEVKRLIEEFELTADDLGVEIKRKGRGGAGRKSAAVKYRKGEDSWSGRGRKPKWVVALVEKEGEEALEKYRVA